MSPSPASGDAFNLNQCRQLLFREELMVLLDAACLTHMCSVCVVTLQNRWQLKSSMTNVPLVLRPVEQDNAQDEDAEPDRIDRCEFLPQKDHCREHCIDCETNVSASTISSLTECSFRPLCARSVKAMMLLVGLQPHPSSSGDVQCSTAEDLPGCSPVTISLNVPATIKVSADVS